MNSILLAWRQINNYKAPCGSIFKADGDTSYGGRIPLKLVPDADGYIGQISQVQVLLVALFSSVLLVRVSGAPRRDMLTEMLRADLAKDKDLTQLLFLKFVSDLVAARENEMLPELEEDELGAREEVMRRHLPLSQRERKAGCRNFFWKTFTSC
ncbi:somatostatin-1 isoform X2 [Myripristis murdjan]|uniref:somatostatin-1 isoform X2 n=1 Tax=Myripristis murdjan TaxID=586833 RepID=UPI00117626D9|nr:somatostatin-1-like isoform X2 [Myripristis murdjan]